MNVDLAAWMFPVLLMLIFIGVPVAFSLMAVAFVFGLLQFGDAAVVMFAHRVEEVSGSHILAALPLFVFMGPCCSARELPRDCLRRSILGRIVCLAA